MEQEKNFIEDTEAGNEGEIKTAIMELAEQVKNRNEGAQVASMKAVLERLETLLAEYPNKGEEFYRQSKSEVEDLRSHVEEIENS